MLRLFLHFLFANFGDWSTKKNWSTPKLATMKRFVCSTSGWRPHIEVSCFPNVVSSVLCVSDFRDTDVTACMLLKPGRLHWCSIDRRLLFEEIGFERSEKDHERVHVTTPWQLSIPTTDTDKTRKPDYTNKWECNRKSCPYRSPPVLPSSSPAFSWQFLALGDKLARTNLDDRSDDGILYNGCIWLGIRWKKGERVCDTRSL